MADRACCVFRSRADTSSDLQVLTRLCQLLGDANRLRIFACLRSEERCVQDIGSEVGLPQNLVSYHLSVLREAGLVKMRREGHWVCYAVNTASLAAIYHALSRIFDPDQVRV